MYDSEFCCSCGDQRQPMTAPFIMATDRSTAVDKLMRLSRDGAIVGKTHFRSRSPGSEWCCPHYWNKYAI